MEYVKRAGRKIFSANVAHNERGDWTITSGTYVATLPMTWPEADAWTEAGRPAEPTALPERLEAFVSKLAAPTLKAREPKRVKYLASAWTPLDGEEVVRVIAIEKQAIRYGEPGEIVTGRVICRSPRCHERSKWLVVKLPGSQYDKVTGGERVEGISPADFAEQHRAWHRETFGVSERIALNEWIERNKSVAAPELSEDERREINLGLAIAKSER